MIGLDLRRRSWLGHDYRQWQLADFDTRRRLDTDQPPRTVRSATYRVCEAGTSTCSNEATVSW